MQQPVAAPTPSALADLVERCEQINRFEMQLTAVESTRVAALASGLLVMRHVLALPPIDAARLPMRQQRIQHWALSAGHLPDVDVPAIRAVRGLIVLDEHEQVKILSQRTWRGDWGSVTLWKHGEHGVSAADMMEFLAGLTAHAQERAPNVARSLLARSQAVDDSYALGADGPRSRKL
jgi:hypothetical protein